MEVNCAFTIAAPRVSWPENCAAVRPAPTRKTPQNAVRSAGGAGTGDGAGRAQPSASTPMKTGSARQLLRLLDDIQGGAVHVHGVAAHHDVEPPRLDHALHAGVMVGQLPAPVPYPVTAGPPRSPGAALPPQHGTPR